MVYDLGWSTYEQDRTLPASGGLNQAGLVPEKNSNQSTVGVSACEKSEAHRAMTRLSHLLVTLCSKRTVQRLASVRWFERPSACEKA